MLEGKGHWSTHNDLKAFACAEKELTNMHAIWPRAICPHGSEKSAAPQATMRQAEQLRSL